MGSPPGDSGRNSWRLPGVASAWSWGASRIIDTNVLFSQMEKPKRPPPPSSEIPPRQAPPCPPWSPLSERLSSWPKRQPFLSAPGENNGLERKLPVRELVVWPTQCQMLMRWRFCRLFRPLNEQCVPLGVYHSALPPRSRWHLLSSSEESS